MNKTALRPDSVLVKDILEAIHAIDQYVANENFSDFLENNLLSSAVTRQLTIVGEASSNLSDNFQKKYPDIPFDKISNIQRQILHEPWEPKETIVWKAYKNNLPELKEKLEKVA